MELKFRTIGISRLRMQNDGEGVTTLAAGYGCPLRCRYCLNPQCFLGKSFREYTLSELLEKVRIDDLYFQATGGGVVFGGGEPLLQAGFIHAFRQICPPEWKLGLETSLSAGQEQLKTVIKDIDFYLVDVKDMNPEIYLAYTGKQQRQTMENLRYLAEYADPGSVCIRLPLIEGFNTEEDRRAGKAMLSEMGFSNFDLFRYQIAMPLEKRKRILEHADDESQHL